MLGLVELYDLCFYYFDALTSNFRAPLPYSMKLITSLFFLMFIRAGLPRYRYDYLTKLGWVKFLLLSLFAVSAVYISSTLWI